MLRLGIVCLCCALVFSLRGVWSQPAAGTITDFAWNANGTQLALARDNGTVEILDAHGQSLAVHTIFAGGTLRSLAWSPWETNRLAVGEVYGGVKVINFAQDPPTVLELPRLVETIRQVGWSADGLKLAVLGENGSGATAESLLTVWDYAGRLVGADHRGFDDYNIQRIGWNPVDSNQLAIGSVARYGAEIRLWDVRQNQVLWQIQEPTLLSPSLAWSSDGTQLVYTGGNAILKDQRDLDEGIHLHVVNAASGFQLTPLFAGDLGLSLELAWSPGADLAAAGRTLQIWRINVQAKLAEYDMICTRIEWSSAGDLACLTNGKVEILTDIGQEAAQ